jgi:hypothetical protein
MKDRCTAIAESGAYSGSQCPKTARFTVAGRRVCGKHVGREIERASFPGRPSVIVVPDFYDESEA